MCVCVSQPSFVLTVFVFCCGGGFDGRFTAPALTLRFNTKTCAFQAFEGPYNVSCSHLALAQSASPRNSLVPSVSATRLSVPLECETAACLAACPPSVSSSSSDEGEGEGALASVLSYSAARQLLPAELLSVAARAVEREAASDDDSEQTSLHAAPVVVKTQAADDGIGAGATGLAASSGDDWSVDVLRSIIRKENPQRPFFLVHLRELVQRVYRWGVAYPHIRPRYSVAHGHRALFRALHAVGCGFACATVHEAKALLRMRVAPHRLVLANPFKSESHLRWCAKSGVHCMTFTDAAELAKIARACPPARLLLHIAPAYACRHVPASAIVDHQMMPGAPMDRVAALFAEARALQVRVVGCSFDVGDVLYDVNQFKRALKDAKEVFRLAKDVLGYELRTLDIGGGFPDECCPASSSAAAVIRGDPPLPSFDAVAARLNHLVPKYFSSKVRVFARPTRFFSASHVLAVHAGVEDGAVSVPVHVADASESCCSVSSNHAPAPAPSPSPAPALPSPAVTEHLQRVLLGLNGRPRASPKLSPQFARAVSPLALVSPPDALALALALTATDVLAPSPAPVPVPVPAPAACGLGTHTAAHATATAVASSADGWFYFEKVPLEAPLPNVSVMQVPTVRLLVPTSAF